MDLIGPAEQRETVKAGVDRVLECRHRDDRLEPLMDAIGVADGIARGSVGGKVAAILRGETDLYVSLSGRSAPKDWDMAAIDPGFPL